MTLLEINAIDRDSFFYDYEFTETLEWYNSFGTVWLYDDDSNTLRNSLGKYQDIKIYDDTETDIKFRGVLVDLETENNNDNLFILSIQDYWYLFTRKHITKTYTNQTASAIITDIINTKFSGDFTTTGITSTTDTYTYKLRSVNVAKFLQELAFQEGFIIFIDTSKDVIFRPEASVSTGKTWVYEDGDILDEKFENKGRDIVNAVFVEGRSGSPDGVGVGAYYVDSAIVKSLDGTILEMSKIVDSTLTTEKQCRDRGETEVRKRNQSAPEGIIEGIKDFDITIGKIHTMTIAHRGYSNSTFLIRSATHKYASDTTKIKVIYTSKDNSELVSEILLQARQLQEIDTDDSTVFPKYIQSIENLVIKGYVTVDKRANAGSYYGNAYYGGSFYGVQNTGAYSSELVEEQIIMVNEGFESMFKIIAQITTVPSDLRNANSYLAVGSSNVAVNFSDTSIISESARVNTELGFPSTATNYELTWEFIISDGDLTTGNIRNIGLLNANANGEMFLAGNLSADVVKSENEDIKFTIRITFEVDNSYLTNAGINLFRDLIVNASSTYLDNTGSWIEIITSPVFRDAMEALYPLFNKGNKLIYQMGITAAEIVSNSLDGKTYTGVDIYDAVTGGNQIYDGETGYTVDINTDEPQKVEVIINGVRE